MMADLKNDIWSYQVEALEMALKQNTLVYFETGTGKTLIAIMLLRSYAHLLRKPSPYIVVFLVPTIVLVSQQHDVVKTYTDLKTGQYYAIWNSQMNEYEAFFEAHFRKKGFPVLTLPECPDDKFSRQELSDINHMNSFAQSDQSLDGLDNNKLLTECEAHVDKADDVAELGTTLAISFESVIQMKENLDCETAYSDPNEGVSTVPQQTSLSKKNSTSKLDHREPRLVPRVSPGPSRSYTAKKTSRDPKKHHRLHKTKKYDQVGSETKGFDSAAGREPAVGVSKSGTRQDTSKPTKKERMVKRAAKAAMMMHSVSKIKQYRKHYQTLIQKAYRNTIHVT
ncbi:hypothetical protein ACS0TY_018869 [Phlomoides rotata]